MNEYTTLSTTEIEQSLSHSGFLEILAAFFLVILIGALIGYVIGSLIYMRVATKAGQTNPWIAWLPFGYAVIAMKLRNKPWYYGLGIILLVPLNFMGFELLYFIGVIAWFIYLDSGILQAFGRDKALAYLHLIPLIGSLIVMILIAVIAFGEAEYKGIDTI